MLLTRRQRNSIAFRIEHITDLCQFAIPFNNIFNWCRFHEERIAAYNSLNILINVWCKMYARNELTFAFNNTLNTFNIAPGEYGWPCAFHKRPHSLICWEIRIAEEWCSWTAAQCTVFDFRLFGQIFGTFDRRIHAFNREKCSQIGCVRRYHD